MNSQESREVIQEAVVAISATQLWRLAALFNHVLLVEENPTPHRIAEMLASAGKIANDIIEHERKNAR